VQRRVGAGGATQRQGAECEAETAEKGMPPGVYIAAAWIIGSESIQWTAVSIRPSACRSKRRYAGGRESTA
jgi:hypothetical protein